MDSCHSFGSCYNKYIIRNSCSSGQTCRERFFKTWLWNHTPVLQDDKPQVVACQVPTTGELENRNLWSSGFRGDRDTNEEYQRGHNGLFWGESQTNRAGNNEYFTKTSEIIVQQLTSIFKRYKFKDDFEKSRGMACSSGLFKATRTSAHWRTGVCKTIGFTICYLDNYNLSVRNNLFMETMPLYAPQYLDILVMIHVVQAK